MRICMCRASINNPFLVGNLHGFSVQTKLKAAPTHMALGPQGTSHTASAACSYRQKKPCPEDCCGWAMQAHLARRVGGVVDDSVIAGGRVEPRAHQRPRWHQCQHLPVHWRRGDSRRRGHCTPHSAPTNHLRQRKVLRPPRSQHVLMWQLHRASMLTIHLCCTRPLQPRASTHVLKCVSLRSIYGVTQCLAVHAMQ